MRLLVMFILGLALLLQLAYCLPRLEKITTKYLPNSRGYRYHDPMVTRKAVGSAQPPQRYENHHRHTAQHTLTRSIQPLDLRSIEDCKLTDLLLISDIDGNLHGVERKSGALLWTLPINEPLVRIQSNNSAENPTSNILWFVEPYQDGSLYYFTPKFGLNRLPTSIKDLVLESPFSLSGDDKIYTGTRRTSLYTINIHTGEITSSFGNEENCPVPNSHYKINSNLGDNEDTIMIGKTTYELSIHSKLNTNVVWNVTYSQWGPNNIDNDLIQQNQQSLDKLYFTPFHDKSLLAINKDVGTPLWISKLPSLAVSVFDVFNNPINSEYIILPHPLKYLNDLQIQIDDANTNFVFVNKTSNGKEWFAMSFNNYPTLIKSAPISKYQLDLYKLQNELPVDIDYIKNFLLLNNTPSTVESLISGIHKVFELTSANMYQPISRFDNIHSTDPIKMISDGRGENFEGIDIADEYELDPNTIIDGIKFPEKITTVGSELLLIDLPSELAPAYSPYIERDANHVLHEPPVAYSSSLARRVFEDLAVLLVLLLLIVTLGGKNRYVQRILLTFNEAEVFENVVIEEKAENEVQLETTKAKDDETITKNLEISSSDTSDDSTANQPKLKKVTIVTPNEKLEDEEETVDPMAKPEADNIAEIDDEANEDELATKKKRKRGSRGGKRGGRRINKNKLETTPTPEENEDIDEAEEDSGDEVEDKVINTKSLVKVMNIPTKIPLKKLQIENNLVISDKILGYGSHGTVVYQGTFENRPVAVKRMLLDFFDIANHEVRLLQESDDHPNVIRYFCSQSSESEKFLYIALELCLCSLEDIIEKPKKELKIPRINDVLYQLASGLHYLHSLKIVHRDLKPQNILVAEAKKTKFEKEHQVIAQNNVRLLISDFGLCKKLESDQSSFRATTQHAALGTSGWRAPELLLNHDLLEISPDTISSVGSSSHHSYHGPSNNGATKGKRLTKAIDIFSLGCVYFYILTGGYHPFGDRYMREGNIIKGNYDIKVLQDKCPNDQIESTDLISRMIHASPAARPSTTKILKHPLFWSTKKRLEFLLKVSDRFEIERRDPPSPVLLKLEERALAVHQGDWHAKFDEDFLGNLGKYRKYHTEKLMDLLRAIRNKYHHYNDMPEELQKQMSPLPDGFYNYFNRKFPQLLMEIYSLVQETVADEHVFKDFY